MSTDGELFLFEGFGEEPKPKKKKIETDTAAARVSYEGQPTKPQVKPLIPFPKPKEHFSYKEYLEMHCGNAAAATYWWKKDDERLEEENRKAR